jgi:flagellar L-ring protein precursor FlgH
VKRALAILFLAAIVLAAQAENLNPPGFKGYLSGKGLAKGDSVFVQIDTTSKLAFAASSTDSRNFTLEFSGGAAGNLFSFIPQGRTGGDRSLKGTQELSLSGRIPATVAEVDTTGRALVRGSRAIEIEGRAESIEISGWVNPRDVDGDRSVSFSAVADARLVYRTLLTSARDVLTAEDIKEVLETLPRTADGAIVIQPAGTGTAPASTGTAATGTAAAATQPAPLTTITLTDQKKQELLLIYLNRLVDLVFGR